jgi:hypothetical protein
VAVSLAAVEQQPQELDLVASVVALLLRSAAVLQLGVHQVAGSLGPAPNQQLSEAQARPEARHFSDRVILDSEQERPPVHQHSVQVHLHHSAALFLRTTEPHQHHLRNMSRKTRLLRIPKTATRPSQRCSRIKVSRLKNSD